MNSNGKHPQAQNNTLDFLDNLSKLSPISQRRKTHRMSLLNLQKKFLTNIQTLTDKTFLDNIQARKHITPTEQLAIYQNSITGRFQKILQSTYPVCEKLVGRDFFLRMINDYITAMPSCSKDLNEYGNSFASFIATFAPAQNLVYLADVARLEWAWQCLDSAPNATVFDFQKLAARNANDDIETIIFLLPPHSTVLTSPYPIHRIWEVNQDDHTDKTVRLEIGQTFYYLVWRTPEQKRIDLLTQTQWQVLNWIQQALPFGQLCETAQAQANVVMPELLPDLIKNGWIVDFE